MKERMKSILFVLALALVFVGAAKITEAAAVDSVINYKEETVTVAAVSGSTYYQIIKKSDGSDVKAKNWLLATKNDDKDGLPFIIDISALSNTATAYIAVAGAADAETVPAENIITIPVKVKAVKVGLNYDVEKNIDGIYDVVSKVTVTGLAKDKGENFEATENLASYVQLGWKRGANGSWKEAEDFTAKEWEMMKNSNTTLYIRVEKVDKEGKAPAEMRFSKEAKVKIPKTAKAPNVKVDFAKGTVAIKNGMEFRVADGAWIKVAPKAKKSDTTATADFFNVATTTTPKSALTMADLKLGLGNAYKDGADLTLEVRTSATDKKFMSYITKISFKTPAAAPTVTTDLTAAIAVTGSKVTVDLTALAKELGEGYEVAFGADDTTADTVSKYVALEDKVYSFSGTAKFSYKKDSKNTSVLYTDATKLFVRKAATKDDNRKLNGFASAAAEVKIGKAAQK